MTAPDKVSAILLSWKRPHDMPRIVAEVASWSRIGEVLVWNNDPETALRLAGATVIDAGRNFGCFARYALAGLAAHDTIWFQDDDVLLGEAQFEAVHAAYRNDPTRLYGCQGRNVTEGRYDPRPVYGACDIVVGQTMLFHRALLRHAYALIGRPGVETGEDDIFFSLACPGPHVAVNVEPVTELDWDDAHALWRRPDHFARRQAQVERMLRLTGRAAAD